MALLGLLGYLGIVIGSSSLSALFGVAKKVLDAFFFFGHTLDGGLMSIRTNVSVGSIAC